VEYFDYDGVDPASGFGDIDGFLERSLENEEERLEETLAGIEKQLESREAIHEENVGQLESTLDWYVDRLETHYQRRSNDIEQRRHLKSRIVELYSALRAERQDLWRDTQKLEQERRKLKRELAELTADELLTDLLRQDPVFK